MNTHPSRASSAKPRCGVRRRGWNGARPQVLFTTNALIGRFMPELADSIVPARAHQIATQIFPEDVRKRVIPERNPIADTRRHTFAVRWSPDGRLVTGGLMLAGPRLAERTARTFTKRLERFFPDIGRVKAEFIWNGVIAVTTDSLPRFISLGPGLDAVIGCNGRGVALTTALGRDIAHALCRPPRHARLRLAASPSGTGARP